MRWSKSLGRHPCPDLFSRSALLPLPQVGSLDALDMYDDRAAGGSTHRSSASPGGSMHRTLPSPSGSVDRLNAMLQRSPSVTSTEDAAEGSGRGLYRRQRTTAGPSGAAVSSGSSGAAGPSGAQAAPPVAEFSHLQDWRQRPATAAPAAFSFDLGRGKATAAHSNGGSGADGPGSIQHTGGVPTEAGPIAAGTTAAVSENERYHPPQHGAAGGVRCHGSALYKNAVLSRQPHLQPVRE